MCNHVKIITFVGFSFPYYPVACALLPFLSDTEVIFSLIIARIPDITMRMPRKTPEPMTPGKRETFKLALGLSPPIQKPAYSRQQNGYNKTNSPKLY